MDEKTRDLGNDVIECIRKSVDTSACYDIPGVHPLDQSEVNALVAVIDYERELYKSLSIKVVDLGDKLVLSGESYRLLEMQYAALEKRCARYEGFVKQMANNQQVMAGARAASGFGSAGAGILAGQIVELAQKTLADDGSIDE